MKPARMVVQVELEGAATDSVNTKTVHVASVAARAAAGGAPASGDDKGAPWSSSPSIQSAVLVTSFPDKLEDTAADKFMKKVKRDEERRKRDAKRLIDPRTSSFVGRWDGVTALALLFTAVVTPFEISFLGTPELTDGRFALNRLIDTIFSIDLVLQFFLMYPHQASIIESVRWIDDHRKIIRHYLLGWFALDFTSVLPFWILDYTSGCSNDVTQLNLLRVIRLVRCIKMVRLLRASRLFKRWQSRLPISHGMQAMSKCIVAIVMFGHWFACVWTLQTSFAETRLDTWLGRGGGHVFCTPTPGYDVNGSAALALDLDCAGVEDEIISVVDPGVCEGPFAIYVASIYLAVLTITSVGYGDISATNTSEMVVLTLLVLLSALMWGLVIATFSGVFSTMNPAGTLFRNMLDDLNRFMSEYGFSADMKRRVREYFYQSRHLQAMEQRKALLELMSPKLQGEVSMLCNRKWIEQIWFLVGCEEAFLVQVALNMRAAVYVPDEMVPPGSLYVLHRGLVLYGGRVISAGQSWGDDMLISREDLRLTFSALALGYSEVYVLSLVTLLELASPFPLVCKRLRYCAVRLALRREFIQIAKRRRADPSGQGALLEAGGSSEDAAPQPQPPVQSASPSVNSNGNFGLLGGGGSRLPPHAGAALAATAAVANSATPGPRLPPTAASMLAVVPQASRAPPLAPGDIPGRVDAVERRLRNIDAKLDTMAADLRSVVSHLSRGPAGWAAHY